jgi:hypothetical protein
LRAECVTFVSMGKWTTQVVSHINRHLATHPLDPHRLNLFEGIWAKNSVAIVEKVLDCTCMGLLCTNDVHTVAVGLTSSTDIPHEHPKIIKIA